MVPQRSLGSKPQTPTGVTPPPRNPATDLDALAGDRWFQTSITCSRSAPALHAVNPQTAQNNHGPEVKGLGRTAPGDLAQEEHAAGDTWQPGRSCQRCAGAHD